MRLIVILLMLLINSCAGIQTQQASHGHHHRSQHAKNEFKHAHPCPSTGKNHGGCPGYVIDHVNPLACGGADAPGNMQWQTIDAGKAKDRWERSGC